MWALIGRISLLCALAAWAALGCDDGGGDPSDLAVVDAQAIEPDAAAAGCARDVDCLAAEYCDREAPAEESDAEPPLGTCEPGCRLEPDTCPRGRACDPETRSCYTECICDPGAVNGCEGPNLRICNDDCMSYRGEACPAGQRCMGGQCRQQEQPMPMPDMAPPPEPDMAPPPEPDMAPPPEPDMAPSPEPDMAPPPAPDMGP